MGLLNPVFLFAAAAVAVPLWLHLSRRRKYKELDVGTLRFLQQALRERKKKSRLEEIPLLLLRAGALVLLALAFARPFWPQAEKAVEKEVETIVLLDASGSMTPRMAELAREAANRAMGKIRDGKVSLAQFSDDVQPIESLENYKPIRGASTDVGTALGWALDHFLLAGRAAGKVILIGHLAASQLPEQPPRVWPPQIAVEIVAIAPPSVDNAAVRRVSLLTPYVAEEMEIEARIWLPPGRTSEEARTVTLDAGNIHESVVAPPGAERVLFRIHPTQPAVRGIISVRGGDAWPDDDRRPFAVQWSEPARLLLIDGQPGNTAFEGQAYFIEKALSASGAAHGKSPFTPEILFALEGRNGPVDFTGIRVIALCGMTELSSAAAQRLAQFVAQGGGLISVVNEKWTPESTARLTEHELFPRNVALTNQEEKRSLASWDRRHPALAMFDGREGGDLRELEWRDGFAAAPENGWRELARLEGGHAVLLEKEKASARAAGSVFVCLHPLNREWTDIPRSPLFVPLIKNLFGAAGHVEPPAPEARVVAPGAHESRPIGEYQTDDSVEVVAPAGDESLVAAIGERAFRTAFGLPATDAAAIVAPPPPQTSERARRGEFWPSLLLALLILLIVENFVATRPKPVALSPS